MMAEYHLVMADLIEAESEADPDKAKIKKLTGKLEVLQAKMGSVGGHRQGTGYGHG